MPASRRNGSHAVCQICGQHPKNVPLFPAGLIRPKLAEQIAKEVPGWTGEGFICLDDLNRFRARYVESMLEQSMGEIAALEDSVVHRIARHETLATDVDASFDRALTLGERVADRVADFGGSWTFILIFALVIVCWMGLNSSLLAGHAFDPYPYILLNLVLSCLAAVQAPVIMMSQNRQEARDRARAKNDYLVNLKAELEIRLLHEKLDYLLRHQWERLMEIQEIQVELMNEMAQRRPGAR
ncbi:DUF1003 domain-containing protein [Benzoatithermus flavus]|uniref:DUF1003 domain-containing protein n=1 Tax=Benzoatithermus flavus TaxID=3108223 RepID=A0ABU8XLA7_9PROT